MIGFLLLGGFAATMAALNANRLQRAVGLLQRANREMRGTPDATPSPWPWPPLSAEPKPRGVSELRQAREHIEQFEAVAANLESAKGPIVQSPNARTICFAVLIALDGHESRELEDWKDVRCLFCGKVSRYARWLWPANDLDVCEECDPARACDRIRGFYLAGIDPHAHGRVRLEPDRPVFPLNRVIEEGSEPTR